MRCLFHQFKVWHVVKILTRYLTRRKMSVSKIWCVVKLYFQKLMRCFSWIRTLTRCTFLFQNLTCLRNLIQSLLRWLFYWKCDALKFSSIPKLMRCKTFNTKSDAFFFKIRRVLYFSVQILTFQKTLKWKSDVLTFFNTESGNL